VPDLTEWAPTWVWVIAGVVLLAVGVATLVGVIKLLGRLFRLRQHLGELGAGGQFAFWGALIYTIVPCDLIPDPVYLDDMAVVAGAAVYLARLWRKRHGSAPLPSRRGEREITPPSIPRQ